MTAQPRLMEQVPLREVELARERLRGIALRTPLVKLNVEDTPASIYLKLENLQSVGSFKIRAAGNAIFAAHRGQLDDGVYTASTGNMARAVAWLARSLGISGTVIVPDRTAPVKLAAIEALGATLLKVPYEEWWQVMQTHQYPGMPGFFVHPVSDPAVIAGNATIGAEILEDLPEVETIIAPYGGGALGCGIASAILPLRPSVRVYGSEPEVAAPFAAALAAGEPRTVETGPTLADAIGVHIVFHDMWPLPAQLLAGSLLVSEREIVDAIRLLAEKNRIVVEGAAATTVAAVLKYGSSGPTVCIISGGNIDLTKLGHILTGDMQAA